MTLDVTLQAEVQKDITGSFENTLEKQALDALRRLQAKGKMTDAELKSLYNKNFQKLLQGDISNAEVLGNKIAQINTITNKLLAIQLSRPKEVEGGFFINRAKNRCFEQAGINQDVNKNSTTENIMKGVIDEIVSLPEMMEQVISHPIDFITGLSALFKGETWKKLRAEISNVGLATPQQEYQSGRSGMMAVMMLFPGAIGKTLLNVGKKLGKVTTGTLKLGGKTIKSIAKDGIKETGKKAGNVLKKETNNFIKSKTERVKNTAENTKNTIKKPFEYPIAKLNNIKAKNTLKKTTEDLKQMTDNITTKQKELLSLQNNLKIKGLKPEKIQEINNKIQTLQKEIPDLAKKQKELNKAMNMSKKEISTTNTKLGIDNNKISIQKRYETNASKLGDNITQKQKELTTAQNNLKIKNLNVNRIKELNDEITKLQKEIPDLTKKQKDLFDKAKNYNILKTKPPRESIRKTIIEKFKTVKGVSIDKLNALKSSPHRLSIVKDLFSLRTLNNKIKKLSQQNEGLKAGINKMRKNGKTAIENAKKNPKFGNNKNILLQERILSSQTKGLEGMIKIQNTIKQKVYNQLTGLGVITTANIKELTDDKVYNLSEYLVETNDQFINNESNATGLESGSTQIKNLDTSSLDGLSDLELQSTKITLTGLASKTGSRETNIKIASERVRNARRELSKKYPSLKAENITLKYDIQPTTSTDDISLRQGAKIKTTTDNLAYVKDYDNIKNPNTAIA